MPNSTARRGKAPVPTDKPQRWIRPKYDFTSLDLSASKSPEVGGGEITGEVLKPDETQKPVQKPKKFKKSSELMQKMKQAISDEAEKEIEEQENMKKSKQAEEGIDVINICS